MSQTLGNGIGIAPASLGGRFDWYRFATAEQNRQVPALLTPLRWALAIMASTDSKLASRDA